MSLCTRCRPSQRKAPSKPRRDVALDSVGIEHGPEKAAQCAEAIKRILGLTGD